MAYVFLFSAKNSDISTKHTQSRTENSLCQFCLIIAEPFSSQRFTHRQSLNYASSQTHRCIQISSTGKTPRENLDVLEYKRFKITYQGSIKTLH